MRSTAVTPAGGTVRTVSAERTASTGTTRRSASGSGAITRPSMGDMGREKTKAGGTGGNRDAVGTGGWAAYNKKKSEHTQRYPTLDIDKDAVVIKFAEAEPFAVIYRHWVAKRPYTCIGEECPLCEAGHRAKPVVFYNVITVNDITLRVWEMSAEPTGKVKKQYDRLVGQDKTLDDPDLYFVVSKARKDNGFFEYDVEKVRASDLEDETRLEPLGADDYDAALKRGLWTDEIIFVNTKSDLRDAVERLSDDD